MPIHKDVREATSFSNFHDVATTHVAIDWRVEFGRKVLSGAAALTCTVKRAGCAELVLDTSSLSVSGVRVLRVSGVGAFSPRAAEWSLGSKHKTLGSALRVVLPEEARGAGCEVVVEVSYETAPGAGCSAVQWLSPEQTAGKVLPYLFTQCQSIHCRSMLPCQDAPCVKATYEARVTVPSPLVALMSAVSLGSEAAAAGVVGPVGAGSVSGSAAQTFLFRQDVPVSSYLIALAVGQLESRDLSPRTRVWSEPSVVELAAFEFAETDRFVRVAEELCGDYVWGRYDLLMLPPSFPYGGMENPQLTFVTPTLLCGDRSLCNVIAHEVTHSWTGNLITNATWSDFWLNEGWTVFIERKILSRMFGERFAALKQRAGWGGLGRAIDQYGAEHAFTRLHIPMDEVDPDDAFSPVAYEKGCAFITYLESVVGGPAAFEPFLRAYMLRFQFGTVSAHEFKAFFTTYFSSSSSGTKSGARKVPPEALAAVDWDLWLHGPGMPHFKPAPDMGYIEAVEQVAKVWVAAGDYAPQPPAAALDADFIPDQVVVLLEYLLEALPARPFSALELDRLDRRYRLSQTRNSEIMFKWGLLTIKAGDERKFDMVVRFLSEQGRMKLVRPLYREMLALNDNGRAAARKCFEANKDNYHAICHKMIARDIAQATQ